MSQPPPPPDRLTQIQDCLDKLAEMMFISLGVTQRDAPLVALNDKTPVTAWTEEQIRNNTHTVKSLAADVSTDIVQTCKVIDYLIDSLPGIDQSAESQMETLAFLEKDSDNAGVEMDDWILKAEHMLDQVNAALRFIADDQFAYLSSTAASMAQV
ncbi:UNVERIFIED_CONTAM: Mediator of RNA polymerase II transcription subunit 21 [Siphonaria sp. JEL0065]|nr:Mediator of RNA polymerase II transcription subunit 21 [Siphonaria sp. JEL0065]